MLLRRHGWRFQVKKEFHFDLLSGGGLSEYDLRLSVSAYSVRRGKDGLTVLPLPEDANPEKVYVYIPSPPPPSFFLVGTRVFFVRFQDLSDISSYFSFGPSFLTAPLRCKDDSLPSFSAGELYLRRGCSLFLSRLFDPLKSYQPYGIIAYTKRRRSL
jgi:hypothetical protein